MLIHWPADDKYSPLNRDNLTQPIQVLLSQKIKSFSEFFEAFLKPILNFEHFQGKDDPHRQCNSEIKDSKKGGWIYVWKVTFQRTLPQATWKKGPNTVEMWTTALLPYLMIAVNIIQLQKVYISAIQNLKTVC